MSTVLQHGTPKEIATSIKRVADTAQQDPKFYPRHNIDESGDALVQEIRKHTSRKKQFSEEQVERMYEQAIGLANFATLLNSYRKERNPNSKPYDYQEIARWCNPEAPDATPYPSQAEDLRKAIHAICRDCENATFNSRGLIAALDGKKITGPRPEKGYAKRLRTDGRNSAEGQWNVR